jgi:hypothetical protein
MSGCSCREELNMTENTKDLTNAEGANSRLSLVFGNHRHTRSSSQETGKERAQRILIAPSSERACNSVNQDTVAFFWRDVVRGLCDGTERTATQTYDLAHQEIWDWVADGHSIKTVDNQALDMHRLERVEADTVYTTEGKKIQLMRGRKIGGRRRQSLVLVSPEAAYGDEPRHAMKRLFKSIDEGSRRKPTKESLSRYFWLEIAKKIMENDYES